MAIKPLHRTMPCHGRRIRVSSDEAKAGDHWTRRCDLCRALWSITLVVAEDVSKRVGQTVLDCQWERLPTPSRRKRGTVTPPPPV